MFSILSTREWGRIKQLVHTFQPSKLSRLYHFNRNINGDVGCRSINWLMVNQRHKWFRQERTHLATYLRLENKLKDQSIVLQSPLFEIPCHRNGFIRWMTNLPVWDVVCHWYSRSRWYSRSQSHWLRLWSFLLVWMCMQNFIIIFHSIQAIGPFSHFQNLELSKASIDDKCHFAIPWARPCQYQYVCKILSKYSKLFKGHGHFFANGPGTKSSQTVRGGHCDYRAHSESHPSASLSVDFLRVVQLLKIYGRTCIYCRNGHN